MADLSKLEGEVLQAFLSSNEYKEYHRIQALLKDDPELYRRVNELREKNYLSQVSGTGDIMDVMDALTCEYEDVINNGLVGEFLEAESALCRMIREFNTAVLMGLEI